LDVSPANEFWQAVHLDPAVEDDYLQRHRLSFGINEFLHTSSLGSSGIWWLSNDVSQWTRKLRDHFGLA
jgi:hypothetical protein